MARFTINDYENYGGGSSNYFSLKDNGDTAKIRFLYNDINDVEGVPVHQVQVDGKTVDIACLRTYDEPIDNCPLCKAGYRVIPRLYIPVFDEDAQETKIWTRGRTFFKKLSSLCSRYNPLVSTVFEVERVGKKGDTNTTYETYPVETDDLIITDFPDINPEEFCFEDKTAEEMIKYLETGMFVAPQTPQRTSENRQAQFNRKHTRTQREMPATPVRRRPNNYQDEDAF